MQESLNDAIIECVRACGGSKQVGAALWPEKTPDAAQRALLDCLNEDRPAKLSPEQLLLILRMARQRGHHDGINYIAAELGYGTPVPIEPRDEIADLQRQFIEASRAMTRMAERMEKLGGSAAS
ncbi:hypothetical protein [Pseudacidovorax sp. NFM-22]|uniref:hypothetical protein n=1 Tax=Pseudacidovorax sp. NFM-22 TaxID=2744469 RepID=UPI001F1F077D|nr:hypothetical protein [Pseudacidovorax sp. NFM-22]